MSEMFVSTMSVNAGIGTEQIEEYLWLVIAGGFVCFAMAWGIGANDVANCFSTSVGAKAISLKQATVIAGIFEFVGAVGLGGTVTSTVRKGIVDWDLFVGEEDVLMLGMFCSLLSAAIWLFVATKLSLPVSTTQSVVGAIAGFALCCKGQGAIRWLGEYEDGQLLKYNGIVFIVLFWIASPFFAAIGSILFFFPLRSFLLRRDDSYSATLASWPLFVFIVVFVMTLFLLIKGLKRLDFEYDEQLGLSFAVTAAVAAIFAVLCWLFLIRTGVVDRMVTRHITPQSDTPQSDRPQGGAAETDSARNKVVAVEAVEMKETPAVEKEKERAAGDDGDDGDDDDGAKSFLSRAKERALRGVNESIHENVGSLERAIQQNSEAFDPRTERAFSWLQVGTATLDIFAHGSNDVANAVAPFAAMVALYEIGEAEDKVAVSEWILVIGAFGMVLGLATYGYKIMKVLGVRMAPMSCSRGYCIELSSALVVILASHYGFPTSTTHAQVGATVGVGLVELRRPDTKLTVGEVVNWKLLAQVLFGWVLTLFISGFTSALIFSFMAFSPYAGEPIVRP